MTTWLAARERWVPGAAGLIWWAVFHPGFIGEDSIIHLAEARSGVITVWFTAWWGYIVDALTMGTRVVSLLTLVSVLTIEYAVYAWMVTVFPIRAEADRRTRALAVLVIAATPLVPGIGIQIRHDVPMTAGLLLCALVITRLAVQGRPAAPDYVLLTVAAPLVATRHNGTPTLIAAATLLLVLTRGRQWRSSVALIAVVAGAAAITYGATRASGNTSSVDPFQTVEWLMGDISCALARGVEPTDEEWATLTRIAAPQEWPHPHACIGMNPLHSKPTFKAPRTAADVRMLVDTWTSLVRREPLSMIGAHATRVRLFLPPFAAGIPQSFLSNFMHSTIMVNDFGLDWTFPAVAEAARNVVRLWNLLAFVIANAAIWLIALLIIAWRSPDDRPLLLPTITIATALLAGLLVAAPQSEGRYGFFILICGQSATLLTALRRWSRA